MPESFGRYELRELLGRGGMGEVYRAFDTVRDREVALKLLPPHLASDESFQSRFRRESRLAARLNDPHIIPIHDFGEIDGRLFLDMRLVQGEDLSAVIARRGRLPADTAVGIVAQVASALDAAHDSGLVHRDVKPSNVLLSGMPDATDPRAAEANPFAYLVDFGIARSDAQEGTALTSTAATLGTVAYLAPERIGGQAGDRRVDVYALACVLFECLAGHKPYDGEMFAIMYGHVNSPPPSVREAVPGAPAGLDAVVRRGMAKDPEQRYATAGDLARDAQAALRAASVPLPPQPVPPRRPPDNDATVLGAVQPPPVQPPPVRRPTAPVPPPSYGAPAGPDGGSRRRGLIVAVIVALLLVAGGVGTVAALSGSDGAPSAGPTTPAGGSGRTTPDFPTGTTGNAAAPLHIASGPTSSWADFSSFADLVGTKDGDTEHAFLQAKCEFRDADATSGGGLAGAVVCTIPSTSASFAIGRFNNTTLARQHLAGLVNSSDNTAVPWSQRGAARGVRYSTPADAGSLDITTTVCAMPTYIVEFSTTDPADLPLTRLRDDYWDKATFPDVVPPTCASDFRSATSSRTEAGVTASKPTLEFSQTTLPAFLRGGSTALGVTTATVGTGREAIVYDQKGRVSFWSVDTDDGVSKVGASTYPVDADLGDPDVTVPEGQVFPGMDHATFIMRGTFTTDGSGNAIAWTAAGKGWGAIKAEADGNLGASGTGIGKDLLGVGDDFGYGTGGRLQTVDCSTEQPISECSGNNRVFKYWKWMTDEFVLVARQGLRR